MHRLGKGLAAALSIALLALSIAACGSGGDETDGERVESDPAAVTTEQEEREKAGEISSNVVAGDVVKTFPPTIVRPGDIKAASGPEAALLEWWQAFQFGDVAAVEDLTSKATLDAVDKKQLAEAVEKSSMPGLEVLGADGSGSTATVRAGLLSFTPDEDGNVPNKPTSSTPEVFTMTKEGGRWLFDSTEYLELKVASVG